MSLNLPLWGNFSKQPDQPNDPRIGNAFPIAVRKAICGTENLSRNAYQSGFPGATLIRACLTMTNQSLRSLYSIGPIGDVNLNGC